MGTPALPVYLLDGEKLAIFDAGLAFLGEIYADGIRQILGHRNAQCCFLTHSHFEYDSIQRPKQSEPAYRLNLEAKIKAIKRRLEKKSEILERTN